MPELTSTFAVLKPDQSVTPVDVSPTIYEELDRRFDGFRGHTLVSSHRVTPGQDTQNKPI